MPKIALAIQHQLPQEEAIRRIQILLSEIRQKYADKINDVQEEWNDNSGKFRLTVMTFPFSGTVTIEETQVKLEAELPLVASAFTSRIEETLRQEADKLLSTNYSNKRSK